MKRMFILLAFLMTVSYGYTQRIHTMQELDLERQDKRELIERADNARIGAHVYDTRLNKPNNNLTRSSVSATYNDGDISSDIGFTAATGSSACPGLLTVTIPDGAVITSVDVAYEMTAQAGAWKSEQRSQLRCVSEGGQNEANLFSGSGNTEGPFVYARTGLTIANNVAGGGEIEFELHAGRTWGGAGCNTTYNKVDNDTWTVTVHYFVPVLVDAAIASLVSPQLNFLAGEHDVVVALRSFGIEELTAATINYDINGIEGSFDWTGSLELNESVAVVLYEGFDFSAPGDYVINVTVDAVDDVNPDNDELEVTVTSWGSGYTASAYADVTATGQFGSVDLRTGEVTNIAATISDPFPMSATFIDGVLYKIYNDFSVYAKLENGLEIAMGTVTGAIGGPTGLAYDEENDIVYLMVLDGDDLPNLYTIGDDLAATIVGAGEAGMIISIDLAGDGYLYGPSLNDNSLYKIDPSDGSTQIIGPIGIDINFGQDVSYDPISNWLYTFTSGAVSKFGRYDLETGEFIEIGPSPGQVGTFAIFQGLEVFALGVNVEPEDGGTVWGAGVYADGSKVNITALPALGYSFAGWTPAAMVENAHAARTTITLSEDVTIQANFEPYAETLAWHQFQPGTTSYVSNLRPAVDTEWADNFNNPGIQEITKVVVHGTAGTSSFSKWTPGETEPFIVRFYEQDPQTEPDWENPVYADMIDAQIYFVQQFGAVDLYKFVFTLSNPVNLQSGWVSVQINELEGEAEGNFFWVNALQGNGDGNIWRKGDANPTQNDLLLELWGDTEVPLPQMALNPNPEDGATGVPLSGEISWEWGANTATYDLFVKKGLNEWEMMVEAGDAGEEGTSGNFSYENLDEFINVQWYVVSYNAVGTSIASQTWSFETEYDGDVFTYNEGNIPTTYNASVNTTSRSAIPGVMTINVPEGKRISSVNVSYDMRAYNGAWMSEQRSFMLSVNNVTTEAAVSSGVGGTAGTFSYNRQGLNIANGLTGDVEFELHAFRTWGGTGANTDYNYVVNGTWDLVVMYEDIPTEPIFVMEPHELQFAETAVGETTLAQTVTITNIGGGELVVAIPVVDNADNFILDFVAEDYPASLSMDESISFTVAFAPESGGLIDGAVTVNYNDGEEQTTTVALSGEGFDPTLPLFAVSDETWNFGNVLVGQESASKTFTISNISGGALEVEAPVLDNDTDFILSFTEEDYPATLAEGESVNFSVVFSSLSEGLKEGEITIAFNDGDDQTAIVELTGTGFVRPAGSTCSNPLVVELPLEDYMDNTQNYGNDYNSTMITGGTASLSYLNGNDFVAQFTLTQPGMLSGGIAGASGSWLGMFILADCPASGTPTPVILSRGSTTGGSFTNVVFEPGTYFAIVSTWPAPQFAGFTLNLSFVPYYEVSFLVTDGTDPIENALIDITPGGTQLTNVSGEAEFSVADGEYNFAVSVDGYTSATGSFMVNGADVVVPEIVLLPSNEITFNVADALANPLNGVNLHIEGTADAGGWDIDQTLVVNGSVVLGLPNGSYTWTAQKDEYYVETDAFVVDGDDVIDISLNIFPLVTFAVEDAEENPLAGVSITIEDMEPIVTNMAGEVSLRLAEAGEYNFVAEKDDYYVVTDMYTLADADLTVAVEMTIFPMVEFTVITVEEGVDVPLADVSIKVEGQDALISGATGEVAKRLPAGNYNFSAYLIGYDEVTGAFDMVNGALTEVSIAMQKAEPRFELTQEWPVGADFGSMVTGLTSEIEFEFTNTGFTDLTLSVENNISINPADGMFTVKAGEGIADEWILATGETGTITVVFTPTSGGVHTADLVFSFGEDVLVALTGEAYEPLALPFMEDFETTGFDQWLVVNGEQVNQWHVGAAYDDTANLSAMISNDEGVTNAYTIDDAASVVHFFMDFTIPDASTTLAFQWKGNGQAAFDFLRVSVVETSVMPQPGSALIGAHVLGSFVNQPNWRAEEITLPEAFEGKTARLVFTWRNNASGGKQPPAAVDNIMLTQTRNIDMVASVDDINVDYKTAPEELPLPETNTVTLDGEYFGETEVDLDVVWDTATPEYNSHVAGTYIFTGQVVMIPGITNTDELTVTAVVTVDKGLPVVTWPAASGITYGETLAASILTDGEAVYHAEAVTGEFTFHTPDFMPQAGIFSADVTFTPDDLDNFIVVNDNVDVDVAQFPINVIARTIIKREGEEYVFEGTEFTVAPSDLFADDAITGVTLTSDGAEATAEVGEYPILISDAVGTGVANYDITYEEGVMEVIDREILTLPNLMVGDKVYDATHAAVVVSWGELQGIIPGYEDVQLDFSNATALFGTTLAGNNIQVTVTGLALTGNDATEYIIGNQIATASILKKDLTVTAEDKTKVYGQQDDVLTVVFDGFVGGQSVSNLGGVLSVVREPGEDTGDYVITASGLTSPNYNIDFVSGVYSITTRAITITADTQTKIYGDDEPELTFQISDDELQFDDEFTGELAREAGEDAGEYEILQGTIALNDNYTLFFESAVFTISPKDIIITADAFSRIYGETDPNLTYQVTTGALQFDDEFTGELTREAGEDVGVYEIQQGTVALTDNYNLSYVAADFSITQRALEITADAKTKVYGDDDPVFTYTITDGDLVFSDELTGELVRETGEDAGEYAITIGTLTAGDNYLIIMVPGNLAISQRDLEITADAQTKVYGETDPVFTWEITAGELQFDDAFSGVLDREAGEDVGNYALNIGTLSAGANYDVTFVPADLAITPLAITVTADDQSKVYGEADPVFTYEVTAGALLFDDAFEGELNRETGEDVGVYAIEQGSFTAGNNYDLTFVDGELAISQLAITVTADDKSKVYGEADPDLTWAVTAGELAFDDELSGELTREAGENVDTYAIEQGTLSAGSNYDLTFAGAELAILAKEVTIGGSFEVADKEYDGTTEAVITDNQLVIIGTVGDDDITLTGLVAEFVSSEPGADISVVLSGAEITGAQAANYLLSMEGAPATTADIFAPLYTLTIEVDPSDAGSVTGEGDYEEGESVTVTALANEGFAFVSWTIGSDEVSTDETYTFDMPAQDLILVANFDIIDAVDDFEVVNVNLFPNPARDNFNITSGSNIRRVIIVDMAGQVVFSNEVDNTEINIENSFETGIYIVRIYTDNGVFVRKLQIQK